MLAAVSLASVIFILTDLVPMYKNRQWKPFFIYTAMMAITIMMAALITLGVKILSPAVILKRIIAVIFGLV
jgi:hypothetical protein